MNQDNSVSPRVEAVANSAGRYRISGTLNHQTVSAIEQSTFVAGSDGMVHIDLSAVEFADSTAVALMLGWVEQIRNAGAHVKFESIPARLTALIEIAGLTTIFAHQA